MNHHCNGYLFFFNKYIFPSNITKDGPAECYKKKGNYIAVGTGFLRRSQQQKESTPVQDALSNKN